MRTREGGFARRTLGRAFHRAMSALSSVHIPEDQLWSRVMTRRFVRAVGRFNERHLYLGGIFPARWLSSDAIPLEKSFKRSSSYGFWKRSVAALDALTSFSVAPLYGLCLLGLAIVILCGVLAIGIVVQKLVLGVSIEGWTTLAVLLLSFMGIGMFTQGILGIYVGKIFAQVKNRPLCIIESSTLDEEGERPARIAVDEFTLHV